MAEIVIAEDHTDEAIDAKNKAVLKALEMIGLKAEGYAVGLCPVDTGLLRNSITHALAGHGAAISTYKSNTAHAHTKATERAGTAGKPVDQKSGSYSGSMPGGEDAVYIGTNVEYAPYVEFGTQRSAAQPFLKPAVEKHAAEYKKIFEDVLNGK